ncbi:sugar ABC transporter permease [Pseudokineococcus sp. 5B2Z-1]|uniref:carbohydrate ABC transporter permease n=1 Tax=Pseudokineococcus sp. 5B2Z-1 TaxID=3132744 RepID=UPI0030A16C74
MTTTSVGAPPPSVEASSAEVARDPARRHGRRLTPYLFLVPFFLVFTTFVLVPIAVGAWASLHRWSLGLPGRPFVGLENYGRLLDGSEVVSVEFWSGMRATGLFTLLSVPLLVVVPFAVAMLLNQKFRGRTFFRAVYFAPYVLGVAVIGLLWRYLLDAQLGPVNQLLAAVGLPGDTLWTSSLPAGWVSLVGVTVWWTLGFNAVIFLAALQDVPAELHEAAKVDGAGAWRRFGAVTLPSMRRVLQFVVTITIIASANMYGQAALVTQEQPGTATRTAIGFIAQTGIEGFDIGSASAMSMVLAVLLMVVSGLVLAAFSRVGGSDR